MAGVEEQALRHVGAPTYGPQAAVTSIVIDATSAASRASACVSHAHAGRSARGKSARGARARAPARPGAADVELREDRSRRSTSWRARRPSATPPSRRTGMNQRTLTPPIDPDELAADSPGDRGRPPRPRPGRPAQHSICRMRCSIDGWGRRRVHRFDAGPSQTLDCDRGGGGLAVRGAYRRPPRAGDDGHHSAADADRGQSADARARVEPHSRRPLQRPDRTSREDWQSASRRPAARRGRGAGRPEGVRQRHGDARGGCRCRRHRRGRDVSRPPGAVRVGQQARLARLRRRRAAAESFILQARRPPQGRRARSTPSSTRWSPTSRTRRWSRWT